MVQALGQLLQLSSDETPIVGVFSKFKAYKDDKDIEYFLTNKAIPNEKQKISKTYLILNDKEWDKGNVKIDGYFSIALKVLCFKNNISKSIKIKLHKNENNQVAAYLIGQLARAEDTPKGFGGEVLSEAIAMIKRCQGIIGGRFAYLDCKSDMRCYYEDKQFIYLQTSDDNDLEQMYTIL